MLKLKTQNRDVMMVPW